jgi:hypothetical protein
MGGARGRAHAGVTVSDGPPGRGSRSSAAVGERSHAASAAASTSAVHAPRSRLRVTRSAWFRCRMKASFAWTREGNGLERHPGRMEHTHNGAEQALESGRLCT